MLRLVAAALLLLALPAHANLGDTVADCVKRYGKPVNFTEASAKSPFGTIIFVAGPYEMVVFLYNGVEVGARISKKDKTTFAPGELKTIMDADAPSPWVTAPGEDPLSPAWTRADHAKVTHDTANKMLIFTTPEMEKELHDAPTIPAAPAAPEPDPVPPHSSGNFAPAAPTQWAPPTAPSTNTPATNALPQ